jgi:hypothetical protein
MGITTQMMENEKLKLSEASNRTLAAQALVRMAECYQKLGDSESRPICISRYQGILAISMAPGNTRLSAVRTLRKPKEWLPVNAKYTMSPRPP